MALSEIAIPAIAIALIIHFIIPYLVAICKFFYHIYQIPTAPGFVPIFGNTLHILWTSWRTKSSIPTAVHQICDTISREGSSIVPQVEEFGCFKFWLFVYPIVVIITPETSAPLYKSATLPKSNIIVHHMSSIVRGFLAMNSDAKYRYHKKLLSPHMNWNLMQRLPPVIAKNGQHLMDAIDHKVKTADGIIGSVQNLSQYFMIRTLLQSAMGFSDQEVKMYFEKTYINQLAQLVDRLFRQFMNRVFCFYVPDKVYDATSEGQSFKSAKDQYHDFAENVFGIAKQLAKQQGWHDDDDDGHDENNNNNVNNKNNRNNNGDDKSFLQVLYDEHIKNPSSFTKEDFKGEFKTFFAGGFESMVTTISWLLHFVGNHPDVQDKIIAEQDSIFGDTNKENSNNSNNNSNSEDEDRDASLEEINNMKYLESVIKETLRLKSTVPALMRTLDKDYIINKRSGGGKNETFVIPKSTEVVLNQYVIQKDSYHWHEPESFNPDRFHEYSSTSLPHAQSFVAFSSGYRACIGRKYAMVVMAGCVSMIFRSYRIKSMQDFGSLVGVPRMSLIPEQEVAIQFIPRKDNNSKE